MKHATTSHFGHLCRDNKLLQSDTASTTTGPTPGASSKIANTSIGVPVVASNTRCLNTRTTGGSQQQQFHTTTQSTLLAAVKLLVGLHSANTIPTNRLYNQHLVTFVGFHEHVMHVQMRLPALQVPVYSNLQAHTLTMDHITIADG